MEEEAIGDRIYGEKAADAGAHKVNMLESDPSRYMLRSLGAGMFLTIVVFLFWVLMHNLQDMSLGKVIASAFFGVGLMGIVFSNAELFTSNNMYLTVSSAEGRTSWGQTVLLWIACYFGNLTGAVMIALLLYGAGYLGERRPKAGRSLVQSVLQHLGQHGWRCTACWAALCLHQSYRGE